jgi:hypothetical protein
MYQAIYQRKDIYTTHSLRTGLYKTVIRSIVTNGAKSWILTNKVETAVMKWKRKNLRKIYGPTCDNGSRE